MLAQKQYELTNHLGNVLATEQDRKTPVGTSTISRYTADVTNATLYYPFGSSMSSMTTNNVNKYNLKYNGKEADDEIAGNSDCFDFGNRIYDSRLGRWLSMDSKWKKYPSVSAYTGFGNNPLLFTDPNGDTLRIGGDLFQATKDIFSLIPSIYHSRVAIGSDGVVTLDISALAGNAIPALPNGDFADAGLQLLFNLTTSKKNYLYITTPSEEKFEVTGMTEQGYRKTRKMEKTTASLEGDDNGVSNLSVNKRFAVTIGASILGNAELRPKQGFDGQVVVSSDGKFTDMQGNDARNEVVFHELWENWERTENGLPYRVPLYNNNTGRVIMGAGIEPQWTNDPNSAHFRSINANQNFFQPTNNPGTYNYTPKKNEKNEK